MLGQSRRDLDSPRHFTNTSEGNRQATKTELTFSGPLVHKRVRLAVKVQVGALETKVGASAVFIFEDPCFSNEVIAVRIRVDVGCRLRVPNIILLQEDTVSREKSAMAVFEVVAVAAAAEVSDGAVVGGARAVVFAVEVGKVRASVRRWVSRVDGAYD